MSARPSLVASARASRSDGAFRAVTLGAGLTVLVILVLIALATTNEAWPALRQEGLRFVTSTRWAPNEGHFGALAFIGGTLVVSTIALVVAVPVSLGMALFLTEVAPARIRKPVILLLDLLAAVPSVVFGFWGFFLLRKPLTSVYGAIADAVAPIPVLNTIFGRPVNGSSFMTAGLILGLMITPIITSLAREVFATVPATQKEGAFGLGATRWEMIRGAVLPYGRAGLVGAVMLGLGRAMGETIAAALVIGSSAQLTIRLFAAGDAMPAVIANQFGEASGVARAALVALGLLLFVITIAINTGARAIVVRSARH